MQNDLHNLRKVLRARAEDLAESLERLLLREVDPEAHGLTCTGGRRCTVAQDVTASRALRAAPVGDSVHLHVH